MYSHVLSCRKTFWSPQSTQDGVLGYLDINTISIRSTELMCSEFTHRGIWGWEFRGIQEIREVNLRSTQNPTFRSKKEWILYQSLEEPFSCEILVKSIRECEIWILHKISHRLRGPIFFQTQKNLMKTILLEKIIWKFPIFKKMKIFNMKIFVPLKNEKYFIKVKIFSYYKISNIFFWFSKRFFSSKNFESEKKLDH